MSSFNLQFHNLSLLALSVGILVYFGVEASELESCQHVNFQTPSCSYEYAQIIIFIILGAESFLASIFGRSGSFIFLISIFFAIIAFLMTIIHMIAFRINDNYNYQPLDEIREEYSQESLLLAVSVAIILQAFPLWRQYSKRKEEEEEEEEEQETTA